MTARDLKAEIGRQALAHGFRKHASQWLLESGENFVVLELQRSSFSAHYYLNVHVYIQGLFGIQHDAAAKLQTKNASLFRREPPEFSSALDLSTQISEIQRRAKIKEMFEVFVVPFSREMHSRESILRLHRDHPEMLFLTPAVASALQSKN